MRCCVIHKAIGNPIDGIKHLQAADGTLEHSRVAKQGIGAGAGKGIGGPWLIKVKTTAIDDQLVSSRDTNEIACAGSQFEVDLSAARDR